MLCSPCATMLFATLGKALLNKKLAFQTKALPLGELSAQLIERAKSKQLSSAATNNPDFCRASRSER